jgi:hypothetical protein
MALGRKTGGRKKGTPNKVTAEIRLLAQLEGPATIARLVKLRGHKNGAIAVAACRELLDRGYGKATQPISGEGGEPITIQVVRFADDPNSAQLAPT